MWESGMESASAIRISWYVLSASKPEKVRLNFVAGAIRSLCHGKVSQQNGMRW